MIKKLVSLMFVALFTLSTAAWAKDDVLRVGVALDAKNLDPQNSADTYSFSIQKQMYEALVTYDSKTKTIVPALAESWEMLDDETYKFNLRKGVKFHNGEEFTADDVIFSFKRVTSPESMFNGSKGKYIDANGLKAEDKYTVIVKTNGPIGGFLQSMNHPYAFILNRKAVEETGKDYSKSPVGTGPYKFAKWVKGDQINLDRFEDYHGKKGNFSHINFFVLPDSSSRIIALETGRVDLIYSVPYNDVARVEATKKIRIVDAPGIVLMHLGLNMRSPVFQNPKTRFAIEYAINKDAFNQVVFHGHGIVPQGPLPPVSAWYPKDAKGYGFDPVKAKALLKEAGIKEGTKLSLITMNIQERIDAATLVQAMLSQVGLNIEVKVLETAIYEQTLQKGQDDMYIATWGMQTCSDASVFWHSLCTIEAVGTTNKTFTEDKELDALAHAASATIDADAKPAAFQKVWDKFNEVHPMVYLSIPNEIIACRKDLQGVENLLDGKINYLGNLSFSTK